jgi:hypothetical protein
MPSGNNLLLRLHKWAWRQDENFLTEALAHLSERNMAMGQVTWELSGGVRALRTLNDTLCEAANACGLQAQPVGGRSDLGVYLDKRKYWIGIEYDYPENLLFWTHSSKVDKDAAERLGINGIYEWTSEPGHGWKRSLNLGSEEVHFFARSGASQLQLLEQFLRECLDTVKQIEIRGEEPPLDENEEADSYGTEPPGPPRKS